MKVKHLIYLILLFMIFSIGCSLNQSTVNQTPETPEQPQQIANLTFEDLPVPTSMTIDRKNSFVYETANYRTGVLYYNGNMSVVEVANFYKSEMPKYNWDLVNSIEYRDGAQLIYEKPNWIVVIRIKRNTFNSSQLVITIGPKGAVVNKEN